MMEMEEIIAPVSREAIISELTEERFLRNTSKAGNQLYVVTYHNAPHILREIGRLREMAFRSSGGGTGKSFDVDKYDTSDHPYEQLIVWDPEDQEITAGYRLIKCTDMERDADGKLISATAHLFKMTDRFINEYLPQTIELGRSFVQPKYQRGAPRKGLFALDNLWDGLGAIMVQNPELKYMFGKVTMYPSFHREARNIMLAFLRFFFPDEEKLMRPHQPLVSHETLAQHFSLFEGREFKEAHQQLAKALKERGESIPPLINSYMNLSPTMKTFGTAANYNFGEVEETGILITFADIDPARRDRYLQTSSESLEFTGPTL